MSMGKALVLASNSSATGAAQSLERGGRYQFSAEATWGGGTVKLQSMTRNGTLIDVPTASFTANGLVIVELPPGQYVANIATATAVFAYLIPCF